MIAKLLGNFKGKCSPVVIKKGIPDATESQNVFTPFITPV